MSRLQEILDLTDWLDSAEMRMLAKTIENNAEILHKEEMKLEPTFN